MRHSLLTRLERIEKSLCPVPDQLVRPWMVLETKDGVTFTDGERTYTAADFLELEREHRLILVYLPEDPDPVDRMEDDEIGAVTRRTHS